MSSTLFVFLFLWLFRLFQGWLGYCGSRGKQKRDLSIITGQVVTNNSDILKQEKR